MAHSTREWTGDVEEKLMRNYAVFVRIVVAGEIMQWRLEHMFLSKEAAEGCAREAAEENGWENVRVFNLDSGERIIPEGALVLSSEAPA